VAKQIEITDILANLFGEVGRNSNSISTMRLPR